MTHNTLVIRNQGAPQARINFARTMIHVTLHTIGLILHADKARRDMTLPAPYKT